MPRPKCLKAGPRASSDQYSLAIVYQEMLTAVLPFPAAPPRSSPPSISTPSRGSTSLPENDQPVIAKAPLQEAGGAVQQLPRAGRCAGRSRASARPARPPPVAGEGAQRCRGHGNGHPRARRDAGQPGRRHASRSAAYLRPAGYPAPSQTGASISRPVRFSTVPQPPAGRRARSPTTSPTARQSSTRCTTRPPLVDVPPPEIDRPTLRRCGPRCSSAWAAAAARCCAGCAAGSTIGCRAELQMLAPMLLIDTDTRELSTRRARR